MTQNPQYKNDQLFMIPATEDVVINQVTQLISKFNIKKLILFEGTCGDGRFIDRLINEFPEAIILANDLDPDMACLRKGIMNYDFNGVVWDEYLLQIGIKSSEVLVCTGFPYGNSSDLAIECLNTVSAYFMGAVVILPGSLNKTKNIDKVNQMLHILKSEHLPKLAFQRPEHEERVSVGSIVTTWLTKTELRPLYNSPCTHNDFSFVSFTNVEKGNSYDIVIQQKTNNLKIFGITKGYNRSVYMKKSGKRFKNAGQDYLFIKIHNTETFNKTINLFKWEILYNNSLGIGQLSKKDFIIAHEFINYGKHEKYINLISNNT